MNIDNEIAKITEYQNSMLLLKDRKSESAIKLLTQKVIDDYHNGQYDFSNFKAINIKEFGKIRHIKTFEPFSSEEILCIYLKRTLDKAFHIKYPNRNKYIHSLFDIISALQNMNDFSILRFDFENFFNTVSGEYVFEKYIQNNSLERFQIDLLKRFVTSTKYTYAGLNTSNILCEIIAKQFDDVLSLKFRNYGLIFYRRYIDDGILVFNRHMNYDLCLSIINDAIQEVFFDKCIDVKHKCKTRLNNTKTKCIFVRDLASSNSSSDFDFLGYQFVLTSEIKPNNKINTTFKYGITQKKIDKYSKRIDDFIKIYQSDMNIELLRHQLKGFTCRIVYQLPKYKSLIWKAKGFISNYQELRYRLDYLTDDTKDFLENSIYDAFERNSVPLPYFLKKVNQEESIYSLYNNLKNYKTLLFVESIGINKDTLDKMCKQIGVWNSVKDYDGLVRDYLIKVKVGH